MGTACRGGLAILALLAAATLVHAQDNKEAIKKPLNDVDLVGNWIYDDLPAAYAEAKKTGKPLLVVFRCVP
jgi:serine protease Do